MCLFAPKDFYTLSFKHLILTGKMSGGHFQNCQRAESSNDRCLCCYCCRAESCGSVPPKRVHTGPGPLPRAGQTHRTQTNSVLFPFCFFKGVTVLLDPFPGYIFFPNRRNWEWNQVYLIPLWTISYALSSTFLAITRVPAMAVLATISVPLSMCQKLRKVDSERGASGHVVLPCDGCCRILQ